MDREDIIRMAREVLEERDGEDYYDYTHKIIHWWGKEDAIVKFANLIAAAERKDCADIAEYWSCNGMPRTTLADQIRARGQA